MMPVDGDWRLDAFGARYTPLSLNFEVRVSSPARVSAEVARNNFVACVVSNSSYLEAYETSRVHAGADGAQQLLLDPRTCTTRPQHAQACARTTGALGSFQILREMVPTCTRSMSQGRCLS